MKSPGFSIRVLSAMLFCTMSVVTYACGPYYPMIPTPEFFGLSEPHKTMAQYERDENLRLWQALTSKRIPIADIEDAVYRDSRDEFWNKTFGYEHTDNLFYIYLHNSDDSDLTEVLSLAKDLEQTWSEQRSPWYYPASRNYDEYGGDFGNIISRCRGPKSKRIKDRYSLQMTRALFASRQYAACIEHHDSAFSDIPDSNLMKRMSQRYVAGCWARLGEKERADSAFARVGDIWSVSESEPVRYMATHNPDAPQLIEYIRAHAADTSFMYKTASLARNLLKENRVRNKGDWNFLLAYVNNEYYENPVYVRELIYRALTQKFSTDELRDLARAYKMKLDAKTGNMQTLLSDLQWIERKTDVLNNDADEWLRRCGNIIYMDWIPRLWKNKDYSTAILLCSYADNLDSGYRRQYADDVTDEDYPYVYESVKVKEIRTSDKLYNPLDYGSLAFQLMESLSSAQLGATYEEMKRNSPLYSYLRKNIRNDGDYYNELIGTLALREENYDRAVTYLSRVSPRYVRTMNIDKCGYLARNPFSVYPSRWETYVWEYDGSVNEYEWSVGVHERKSNPGAKLDFARRMCGYRHTMQYGKTADERGMARLMYAIGRRNSFEECWALTQYGRGFNSNVFCPTLQYWDDGFAVQAYGFMFDYDTTIGHKRTDELYDREIAASLAMLTGDEALAKAHYILGNLKTVIKRYGNTTTARHVKTSCDNWKTWL